MIHSILKQEINEISGMWIGDEEILIHYSSLNFSSDKKNICSWKCGLVEYLLRDDSVEINSEVS